MNRRHFLRTSGLSVLLLATRGVGAALAAPAVRKSAAPSKPRPPGTCGGWVDADANGVCEHSVRKERPCLAVRCPGHANHEKRAAAEAAGAPKGSCALWSDPGKRGFCAVCLEAKPCLYTVCPSHKAADGKKSV
jgi:hypothetical protein